MKAELLLQEYESRRGFIRDQPDHELLTLIGRLATNYVVRKGGAEESETALVESVGAGVGIARAILDTQ
jgi:hypothetical protein